MAHFADRSNLRKKQASQRKFKFGDSRVFTSSYSIEVCLATPVVLGDEAVEIRNFWIFTDVLAGLKTPMLISRQSLEAIRGCVDFTSHICIIRQGKIHLESAQKWTPCLALR